MINKNGDILQGAFPAFGLEPECIIAHDFSNPQQVKEYLATKSDPPTHWCMYGMCNDELMMVYEFKDGVVLKDLFEGIIE
jgi:hypothetical protein